MATKKKKTASKKKAKKKDEILLELDGQVNIVEITNGKESRTVLDADIVLQILVKHIEKAVEAMSAQEFLEKHSKK